MAVIHQHYNSLEADWLSVYNRKLNDDLWGASPLSIRYLFNLIMGLPAHSNFRIGMKTHWTDIEELLALTVEMLDIQRREFLALNVKQGTTLPQPLIIPRPYDTIKESKKFGTTKSELLNMLGEQVKIVKGVEK